MKKAKFFNLISLLFSVSIILVSCSKDKSSSEPEKISVRGEGNFLVNGVSYNTPYGYIRNNGSVYRIYLTDLSDYESFPDWSIMAFFQINYDGSGLEGNEFNYDINHETGLIESSFDTQGQSGERLDIGNSENSGTIEISKEGDKYIITYRILTGEGVLVTGSFNGEIN